MKLQILSGVALGLAVIGLAASLALAQDGVSTYSDHPGATVTQSVGQVSQYPDVRAQIVTSEPNASVYSDHPGAVPAGSTTVVAATGTGFHWDEALYGLAIGVLATVAVVAVVYAMRRPGTPGRHLPAH